MYYIIPTLRSVSRKLQSDARNTYELNEKKTYFSQTEETPLTRANIISSRPFPTVFFPNLRR